MKSKLRKYYLYGLFPALILSIILGILSDFMVPCFFMVGFMWPYSNYTPNLREKLSAKSNRMAFINMSVQCHDFLFEKLETKMPHAIIRSVMPIAFAIIIYFVTYDIKISFIILGLLAFELFFYISKKRQLDIF